MSDKNFVVGDFWRTRNGRKARILATDGVDKHPIIALVDGYPFTLTIDGNQVNNCCPQNGDLVSPWADKFEDFDLYVYVDKRTNKIDYVTRTLMQICCDTEMVVVRVSDPR